MISVFTVVREGSQLCAFLMLFQCCIYVVMCSGRSLHVIYMFPFGMLFAMSVWSIMLIIVNMAYTPHI